MKISRGEVVGLLGPNGAGKTTSFYMIVGLIPPETGRVLVDDTDITRLPMYLRARNFGISYLPQEPSVFRKLTVEENILAVLEAQPLDSAGAARARRAADHPVESGPYSHHAGICAFRRRAAESGNCALAVHSTEFHPAR